tara:strand:+ start:57815 stop:59671 length:1857 start_codon:yes stop_codon:yes gene_type:complete
MALRRDKGDSRLRRINARWLGGGALLCVSLLCAAPLIAGRAPTSLLPPGFGSEPAPEEPTPQPGAPPPVAAPVRNGQPGLQLDLSDVGGPDGLVANIAAASEELTPEELAEQQRKYDLPPRSTRSLDRIGPLTPATGGLASDAFGSQSGQFLGTLMRTAKAPFVSRWGSILLRRALLSATDTPGDVNGADWAAERAWLLVRMGEADSARLMVQSVDARNYSDRLYAVAMQAYLASADPVGLCPIYQGAKVASASPSWQMAEAICASFSAEQGRASAILNQAERRGRISGIDYRLTEKIVGAGVESRRSVKIEWDGVDTLTAWRYGLATAANVDIPAPLMRRAGRHVWAWQARAPMLPLEKRLPAAETAARLGVFSSAALVDIYSQLDGVDDAPDGAQARADAIRLAYMASTVGDRIDAMREIWSEGRDGDIVPLLVISRAAAALPVADVDGEDISHLIAAMLSAGYDKSAMRWAGAAQALADSDGADGWAMLAVGAPQRVVDVQADRLRSYVTGNGLKGAMLIAGLAGLNRASGDDMRAIAQEARLSFAPRTRWEKAIEAAASRKEKGTVALLAAIGMQVSDWSKMPPEHLYHIVSALHRVGMDPEARMIAAEAIMRS